MALLFAVSPHSLVAQTPSALEERRPGQFLDYQAAWQGGTQEGGTLVRQELSFALPLARLGNGVLALNGNVRWLLPHSDALFPESGTEVPGSTEAFKIGVEHIALYRNGWVSRVAVSGLAWSSVPGSDGRIGFAASGLLRVPVGRPVEVLGGERDAWRFIIVYAPTESDFPFPLPLAAYEWRPDASFRMHLGLPFLVFWRPLPHLTLTATYAPIARIDAIVDLAVAEGPLSLFVGFAKTGETYAIVDIEDDTARLHSASTALKAGLRLAVSRRGSLRIGVKYFLARSLVLGERITDGDRINSDGGFSVEAGYRLSF